ncbi:hypothetical protein CRG98_038707 [Punica granatum]|uniref:Uncharacterized protein n=1 Tax=Punica granatum TaxID=22663 RepID=A0A2I0IAA1_PUNGR|nr:hypothetical protein CRG98_038707 [Punica granatum]
MRAQRRAHYGTLKIPLSVKVTNDTSERVSGAYRLSRDTPDLSRTPFLTGLPGSDPLTRFPEGRFSGNDRLPMNLRGTFTENRDHSDPRTPQDIRGTLRKPRSQISHSRRTSKTLSNSSNQPWSFSPSTVPSKAENAGKLNHFPATAIQPDPNLTKLHIPHVFNLLSPFPTLDFSFEAPSTSFQLCPDSGTYRSARVESRNEPPITVIFTQLGVQFHRSCTKKPPGTSCRPVSSSGASRENLRMLSFRNHRRHDPQWKIYMCSPLKTTAGVILSPLGIQHNRPRTKRPPRSTGTAPTSRTASRVCQSTRPHRFGSVHSRGQNRLPKPLFPAFLDFSCIPGLVLSPFFCIPLIFANLSRFGPESIDYVLHEVQRPKPSNTRSNVS